MTALLPHQLTVVRVGKEAGKKTHPYQATQNTYKFNAVSYLEQTTCKEPKFKEFFITGSS